MKNLNNKLEVIAKQLATLTDDELEKALINRAILDRIYLMRKNRPKRTLLEGLTFREVLEIEDILN